ncbi:hypothetical protein BKA93DRAFT_424443 [Sparassis latifolia]
MRPIVVADIQSSISLKRPVLFLDANQLSCRWLFIAAFRGHITSLGGIAFPEEIWRYIQSEIEFSEPEWVAVRPDPGVVDVAESLVAIRCTEIALSEIVDIIKNADDVHMYEKLFADTTDESMQSDFLSIGDRPLRTFTVTYQLPFASGGEQIAPPNLTPCLFTDITIPDYISRIQRGKCWVCGGGRTICPGCTEVPDKFDAFMGCGVALACPLCMGLDFCWEDKTFWQTYYRKKPPKEEKISHDRRVNRRRAELGYPPYSE